MKMPRRLPEIDLARLVALPEEHLRAELRRYVGGGGPWSYEPARNHTSDILQAKVPLGLDVPRPTWNNIKNSITNACKRGVAQITANVGVAKALHTEAQGRKWAAAVEPMDRLAIGPGEFVRFWHNVVVQDEYGLFIPFLDHRRTNGLSTPEMRRVVYSMQRVGVRDRNPDLAEARLVILQFPNNEAGRGLRLHFHSESDLIPYEELNQRVQRIYEIFADVAEEQTKERRRA